MKIGILSDTHLTAKSGILHSGILCFNPGSPTDRIFAPYNKLVTGTLVRL